MMVFWLPVGLWLGWQQVPLWDERARGFIMASGIIYVGDGTVLLRGYRTSGLAVVCPLARGSGPSMSSLFVALLGGHGLGEGDRASHGSPVLHASLAA